MSINQMLTDTTSLRNPANIVKYFAAVTCTGMVYLATHNATENFVHLQSQEIGDYIMAAVAVAAPIIMHKYHVRCSNELKSNEPDNLRRE